jgi:hypothetical protein
VKREKYKSSFKMQMVDKNISEKEEYFLLYIRSSYIYKGHQPIVQSTCGLIVHRKINKKTIKRPLKRIFI